MYARHSTLRVNPDGLNQVLAAFRNQVPTAIENEAGHRGTMVLVDRDGRRIAYISLWDTTDQAQTIGSTKGRLDLLERITPHLHREIETEIFEVATHPGLPGGAPRPVSPGEGAGPGGP